MTTLLILVALQQPVIGNPVVFGPAGPVNLSADNPTTKQGKHSIRPNVSSVPEGGSVEVWVSDSGGYRPAKPVRQGVWSAKLMRHNAKIIVVVKDSRGREVRRREWHLEVR